ncbi:MAG TPA: hypothetical protein PL000_22440 [Anaerolineales bacterium]|nr:hypothetical protein [Anaerolineales bacterium]
MKKTTDRILTAIFCDDIRHEVGNKMSFMGSYQGELFVPAVPTGLSKLCIFATALTPIGRPFKSLTFRIVMDDNVDLARLEIPTEAFPAIPDVVDETATRKSVSTALMFSPFIIEKPTSLRLMADTEEGEIVGPRLLIKVAPEMLQTMVASPAEQAPIVVEKKTRRKRTVPAK